MFIIGSITGQVGSIETDTENIKKFYEIGILTKKEFELLT
jgi:hypothetical protein